MKRLLKKAKRGITNFFRFTYFEYIYQFISFRKRSLESRNDFKVNWKDRFPILNERTKNTKFDAHYVYHPAWAARILFETRPSLHVDISSSLNFCAMVSSFVKVDFYDYRPVQLNLDNITCKFADLSKLPFLDNSVESLSCMHVIEHIGLGRYGDSLDPNGDIKAISELKRVIKPGGRLLIVVPIGKPRICFNAHRIYDPMAILKYFDSLKLLEFAVVNDSNQFVRDVSPTDYINQKYACGCFYFQKTSN